MSNSQRLTFIAIKYFFQACWHLRVFPWRYFYLNIEHLDHDSGVYSKYRHNQKIPSQWQLKTRQINHHATIKKQFSRIKKQFSYPVFIKPDWGQNSMEVYKINHDSTLRNILQRAQKLNNNFICQSAAKFTNEYDICLLRSGSNFQKIHIFSIVQSILPKIIGDGRSSIQELITKQLPELDKNLIMLSPYHNAYVLPKSKIITISSTNSVYHGTKFIDHTASLSTSEKDKLLAILQKIGHFSMTRISISANSISAIIAGKFQVLEINLFSPSPLYIFDKKNDYVTQKKLLQNYAWEVVRSIKNKPAHNYPQFWPSIKLVYSVGRILFWPKHKHV